MIPYGYLAHHGILGQKWGVRRFENEDGTLTNAGKKRYRKEHLKEYVASTDKYMTEYRTSKEGSEKFNKLKKRHTRSERDDYYKNAADYTAKKLLSEYGDVKLSALEYRKGDSSVVETKRLIDRIAGQIEYNYDFLDAAYGLYEFSK